MKDDKQHDPQKKSALTQVIMRNIPVLSGIPAYVAAITLSMTKICQAHGWPLSATGFCFKSEPIASSDGLDITPEQDVFRVFHRHMFGILLGNPTANEKLYHLKPLVTSLQEDFPTVRLVSPESLVQHSSAFKKLLDKTDQLMIFGSYQNLAPWLLLPLASAYRITHEVSAFDNFSDRVGDFLTHANEIKYTRKTLRKKRITTSIGMEL